MRRFENKVAVVTGGAHGIGLRIAERFALEGAKVEVIDLNPPSHDGNLSTGKDDSIMWHRGDIADKTTLEQFAADVIGRRRNIDFLINNALPIMRGIDDCSWEEFLYAQKVGVAAPFYLAKLFSHNFNRGAAIVNISSTRAFMSQPQTESYSAAKGGISALTHSLAVSLAHNVRVNAISPGWINTAAEVYSGADTAQHPANRVGNPDDIASLALFLCSAEAGFITGENIVVDGGMTRQMIYHNDHGWRLE